MSLFDRFKRGWNVFRQDEKEITTPSWEYGPSVSAFRNTTRSRSLLSGDRSILSSIYTRIGIDVSSLEIKHVRLDEFGEYKDTISGGLNDCLNVEANIDQAATAFKLDVVMSLLEHGVIAVVPVDTSSNPNETGSYEIKSLRVGKITQWYPYHVTVDLYDERYGVRKEITIPKRIAAIIENPLYSVMNEPNSTYQRLVRKLDILDVIDEQSGSGKLDIIIQLPYTIKSETRKHQAEQRAASIETQLKDSKYGIAYIDSTESITQLNRPAENNILKQVEYLTSMLYGQLGITEEVLAGTATEEVMVNYQNRTIKPLIKSVTEAMDRAFITKTARTQGHAIRPYRDLFESITPSSVGDLADKLTRNEIVSSNEMRSFLGLRPSNDPRASELVNKNMPRIEGSENVIEDEVDTEIVEVDPNES